MTASSSSTLIQALSRSNLAILRQKLDLMEVMRSKFGTQPARDLYRTQCPIVHASIGQHIRHSVDHMQNVTRIMKDSEISNEIHYDLRERGGDDEHDMDKASERISIVMDDLTTSIDTSSQSQLLPGAPVTACFMLSSDGNEFDLQSTVERELGFAAHHAIHHMALVKIIALNTLGLQPSDLSPEFGRAPSTAAYDKTVGSE